MLSSLFVCLSCGNFAQKLPNGFAWNFQRRLAIERIIKFRWQFGSPSGYRDCFPDSSLLEGRLRKVVNGHKSAAHTDSPVGGTGKTGVPRQRYALSQGFEFTNDPALLVGVFGSTVPRWLGLVLSVLDARLQSARSARLLQLQRRPPSCAAATAASAARVVGWWWADRWPVLAVRRSASCEDQATYLKCRK